MGDTRTYRRRTWPLSHERVKVHRWTTIVQAVRVLRMADVQRGVAS